MAYINGQEVLFSAKVNITEGGGGSGDTGSMPFPPDEYLNGDGFTVFPVVEDETGEVAYRVLSDMAIPWHVVQRDADGDIELPEQDVTFIEEGYAYAVSGGTVRQYVDSVIGNISTALDEIIALQNYYTGATFDELHEYATNVAEGGTQ